MHFPITLNQKKLMDLNDQHCWQMDLNPEDYFILILLFRLQLSPKKQQITNAR